MKAVSYDHHGTVEVLQYRDVADPEPGPVDVVIAVEACALNRLDLVQRAGYYTLPGYTLPHIAGMDIAGTVIEIGAAVTDVAVGDRVVVDPSLAGVDDRSTLAGMGDLYGDLGVIGGTVAGGYAERCVAPASHVFRVPDSMAIEHAATFPTCFLTASHALFPVGALTEGETVLIHAAGSGVSVAAIQLAVAAGATVLATAGTSEKLALAEELGATHVLNNRTGDVTGWARQVTQGRGVDMVLDHVGTALFGPSLFTIAPKGRLVSCGNTSGDVATIPSLGYVFHMGISIRGSDPYPPEEFRPTWDTFCSGDFVTAIHEQYPLADAAVAQAQLEANDVIGKVVLRP
jgi:NADPH:quinone reductase-like Zn-dependent oxidoreductase